MREREKVLPKRPNDKGFVELSVEAIAVQRMFALIARGQCRRDIRASLAIASGLDRPCHVPGSILQDLEQELGVLDLLSARHLLVLEPFRSLLLFFSHQRDIVRKAQETMTSGCVGDMD